MGANIIELHNVLEETSSETLLTLHSYFTYSIFITLSILTGTIIAARMALAVHTQLTPINMSYFFEWDVHGNIRLKIKNIEGMFVYDDVPNQTKPDFFNNVKYVKKILKMQHQLIHAYIQSCENAIENSKRIKKWLKISQLGFIIGLGSSFVVPMIIFFI